jgi:hypothetical protein
MPQRFSFGSPSGGEYIPTLAFVLTDESTKHSTPLLTAIVDTGEELTFLYEGPERYLEIIEEHSTQ